MTKLVVIKHKGGGRLNNNPNDMRAYEDIINLPHHQSSKHPHMSMIDRASQFSSFAALTGHSEAIKETGRLVDKRMDLSNDIISRLDEQLQLLLSKMDEGPTVVLTYFVPDEKKSGGKYITVTGDLKKIDEYDKMIILEDETKIPINEIIEITILTY